MAPMAGIVGMMGSIFKKTPEEKAEPRTPSTRPHSFMNELINQLIISLSCSDEDHLFPQVFGIAVHV
jgi:hypothetical protein